ncbi:MAG: MBL fold metallo-hydrolase [Chloroflexi bacterium]|nr:MBL fold metallo-hydrolase [Chloroflexota bacterium]MBP8057973.1 MBL fold metallo-hydrolase [Chloroflexota bacterium]
MAKQTIDVNTLLTMLTMGEPVTVLDVRHTEDYQEWTIPGSTHIDVYDALKTHDPQALGAVHLQPDKLIITVCGAGVVSLEAARQLRQRGYEALSLVGGMKAWSLAWNSATVPTGNPETHIIQIQRTGKGCLSYLIGSSGQAAVIDAALDPGIYLELAQQKGWQITHVLDTHIHADHLSRSRRLAKVSGAALYLPAQGRLSYPFTTLHHQDVLQVGSIKLTVIHTPGHTTESVCYYINDEALLTGDTLFLAAVGRPDLKADMNETHRRACMLFSSLQQLLTLPPQTIILPGHTSHPVAFDRQAISASLAQVQRETAVLSLPETEFIDTLLQHLPGTPPNHLRIVALNEAGELPEGDVTDLEAGANRCAVG